MLILSFGHDKVSCALNGFRRRFFFTVSSTQSGCCLFVTGRNKQFIVRPEAWYVIAVAGMCNNKNI